MRLLLCALTLLAFCGCDKPQPGDPCEATGDGFTRRDPCEETCVAWPVTCPDGTAVVPEVCSSGGCFEDEECGAGWFCGSGECLPEDVCEAGGKRVYSGGA